MLDELSRPEHGDQSGMFSELSRPELGDQFSMFSELSGPELRDQSSMFSELSRPELSDQSSMLDELSMLDKLFDEVSRPICEVVMGNGHCRSVLALGLERTGGIAHLTKGPIAHVSYSE
jgi:hypothetical protein